MAQLQLFVISTSFTRPNDTIAYTTGDLVANSTTVGSVVPLKFRIPGATGYAKITGVGIAKSTTTSTLAKWKVHLYNAVPTPNNGDNGVWLTTGLGYITNIAVDSSTLTFSAGTNKSTASLVTPLPIQGDSGGFVYAFLADNGGYTPAANEVFTVDIMGEAVF